MGHRYQIYRGNKRLHPKAHLPIIIVVAQKDKGTAFAEHYIFTGFDKPSLLPGSTGYDTGRGATEAEFNAMITEDGLVASELELAKSKLENLIYETDKKLHQEIFWHGSTLEFVPVDEGVFVQLAMNGKKSDMVTMFDETNSQALERLEKLWKVASKISVRPKA